MLPESHLTPTAQHDVTLPTLLPSPFYHLCQEVMFAPMSVCLLVDWLVGLSAGSNKNYWTDFGQTRSLGPEWIPLTLVWIRMKGRIKDFLLTFFNTARWCVFSPFSLILRGNNWILMKKNPSILVGWYLWVSTYICIEQIWMCFIWYWSRLDQIKGDCCINQNLTLTLNIFRKQPKHWG